MTSLALLGWFTWFPEARSPEDVLQEAFKQSVDEPAGEDLAEHNPVA